jgi:hypothetical protein
MKKNSSKNNSADSNSKNFEEIVDMFRKSYPEKIVSKIYEECGHSRDRCIERLLEMQNKEVISGREVVTVSGSTAALSPTLTLTKEYEGLLSTEDISQIISSIQRDFWSSGVTDKDKVDIGRSYAEQLIRDKYSDEVSCEPRSDRDVKEKTEFVELFYKLIPQAELDTIWNSVEVPVSSCPSFSSSKVSLDEKLNLATLYAMEYLDGNGVDRKSANTSGISSKTECSSLHSYLINQEKNRLKSNSSKNIIYSQSTRDSIAHYVFDIFKDTKSICEADIVEELMNCNYNVIRAIENLCEKSLKSSSFARGITYSEAVFSSISTSSSLKSSRVPTPLLPDTEISTVLEFPSLNINSVSSKSKKSPGRNPFSRLSLEKRLNFSRYFYDIFKKRNSSLSVGITQYGELEYRGSSLERNYNARDSSGGYLTIVLDLHNLPVHHAIELVASSTHYYQTTYQNEFFKHIILLFVVGKGLHSPGGVPKLGPAIEKLLIREFGNNYVYYDGEIAVTIHR